MEIVVDFGLFEVMAALGFIALARKVYSRKWLAFAFLLTSVVLPAVLVFVVVGQQTRWLAVGSLVSALTNAAVLFGAIHRGVL